MTIPRRPQIQEAHPRTSLTRTSFELGRPPPVGTRRRLSRRFDALRKVGRARRQRAHGRRALRLARSSLPHAHLSPRAAALFRLRERAPGSGASTAGRRVASSQAWTKRTRSGIRKSPSPKLGVQFGSIGLARQTASVPLHAAGGYIGPFSASSKSAICSKRGRLGSCSARCRTAF